MVSLPCDKPKAAERSLNNDAFVSEAFFAAAATLSFRSKTPTQLSCMLQLTDEFCSNTVGALLARCGMQSAEFGSQLLDSDMALAKC